MSSRSLFVIFQSFSGQLRIRFFIIRIFVSITNQKTEFPKPSTVYQPKMYTSEGSKIRFIASPNKLVLTLKMECIPQDIFLIYIGQFQTFNQNFPFFKGGQLKINLAKNGVNQKLGFRDKQKPLQDYSRYTQVEIYLTDSWAGQQITATLSALKV